MSGSVAKLERLDVRRVKARICHLNDDNHDYHDHGLHNDDDHLNDDHHDHVYDTNNDDDDEDGYCHNNHRHHIPKGPVGQGMLYFNFQYTVFSMTSTNFNKLCILVFGINMPDLRYLVKLTSLYQAVTALSIVAITSCLSYL